MKVKIASLIGFIVLLLGSLRSFNFFHLGGVRWFVILSFVVLILSISFIKINKKILFFTLTFYGLCFINIFISFFYAGFEPHILSYFGFIISPAYFLLLVGFFQSKKEILLKQLKRVLIFHLFFFYLQWFVFVIFRFRIDFLKYITNEPQRTIGGIFTEDTIIRGTGLFNEPASYSIFAVSMIFCLMANKKKIDKLILLAILSVILSFSASGIMFLAVMLIVFYFSKIFSRKVMASTTIIVLGFLLANLFIKSKKVLRVAEIFSAKIKNFQESESYKYRIGNVSTVFEDLTIFKKTFGIGYGNLEVNRNLGSFLSQFFIQSGVLFFILLSFLFFYLFKEFKVRNKIIIIIMLLTLSTQAINHMVTWYFFAIILVIEKHKFDTL